MLLEEQCEYIHEYAPTAALIPHTATLLSCALSFGLMAGYKLRVTCFRLHFQVTRCTLRFETGFGLLAGHLVAVS